MVAERLVYYLIGFALSTNTVLSLRDKTLAGLTNDSQVKIERTGTICGETGGQLAAKLCRCSQILNR